MSDFSVNAINGKSSTSAGNDSTVQQTSQLKKSNSPTKSN